jgi:carboxyl-terminal processing protease
MDDLRNSDGIVLDLRGNPGGLAALVMGIGGHFLSEPASLGEMRMRDATLRFVVNPQLVTPDGRRVEPFAGPLAILVDGLSASTSEVFAGGMRAIERARIFGEPTAGQALPALVTVLPNGDRLLHAIADFTASDGTRLEGAGVVPDVFVPLDRSALLAGQDVVLDAALAWLATASR